MKHLAWMATAAALILSAPLKANAQEVSREVLEIVPELHALGQNPVLVAAVKAQNAEGLTLDAIKQRDKEWRAFIGYNQFMDALLSNDAALEMRQIERSQPYFTELFLTDNQGANVAMTNKTTDYWQGDESKWQEAFKDGSGAIHVGDIAFDESAQAYLVQISVPVMENNRAIGVITIGINLDEVGH